MAKSMRMGDIIDFVTVETDQESCSETDLNSEKESYGSDISLFPETRAIARAHAGTHAS